VPEPVGRAPEAIETARLLLRRPLAADAEVIFRRYASDPAVTRYMSFPRHQTVADTQMFLDFSEFEWNAHGCGPYLVLSRESSEVLGGTGLSLQGGDEAETGYLFARDAWGCGYATEALHAMVDAARSMGLRSLTAHCHPEHRASMHVLEKCGFTFEHRAQASQQFPNLAAGKQDVVSYTYTL